MKSALRLSVPHKYGISGGAESGSRDGSDNARGPDCEIGCWSSSPS